MRHGHARHRRCILHLFVSSIMLVELIIDPASFAQFCASFFTLVLLCRHQALNRNAPGVDDFRLGLLPILLSRPVVGDFDAGSIGYIHWVHIDAMVDGYERRSSLLGHRNQNRIGEEEVSIDRTRLLLGARPCDWVAFPDHTCHTRTIPLCFFWCVCHDSWPHYPCVCVIGPVVMSSFLPNLRLNTATKSNKSPICIFSPFFPIICAISRSPMTHPLRYFYWFVIVL